jgi:hypothetical protein
MDGASGLDPQVSPRLTVVGVDSRQGCTIFFIKMVEQSVSMQKSTKSGLLVGPPTPRSPTSPFVRTLSQAATPPNKKDKAADSDSDVIAHMSAWVALLQKGWGVKDQEECGEFQEDLGMVPR